MAAVTGVVVSLSKTMTNAVILRSGVHSQLISIGERATHKLANTYWSPAPKDKGLFTPFSSSVLVGTVSGAAVAWRELRHAMTETH